LVCEAETKHPFLLVQLDPDPQLELLEQLGPFPDGLPAAKAAAATKTT
jgi:hypothetical protein